MLVNMIATKKQLHDQVTFPPYTSSIIFASTLPLTVYGCPNGVTNEPIFCFQFQCAESSGCRMFQVMIVKKNEGIEVKRLLSQYSFYRGDLQIHAGE